MPSSISRDAPTSGRSPCSSGNAAPPPARRSAARPPAGVCRVRPQDYPLAAPAVPVQEGVDAAQQLGGEGARRGEQVQVLQDGGADLVVPPAQASGPERFLHSAEAPHLVRQNVAHAGAAQSSVHWHVSWRDVPYSSAAPQPIQRGASSR